MTVRVWLQVFALIAAAFTATELLAQKVPQPGSRVITDAHNCYPYFEWWGDRIDRALSTGAPVAIEQDLAWYTNPVTGKSWSVVTHGEPVTGREPTLEKYFFERVRPTVEKALRERNHGDWPLITLNLDFKDNKPEHLAAVLALLRKYDAWITSAPRVEAADTPQPLEVKPILVLTGEADAQQKVFHDDLNPGERILAFGAIHTAAMNPQAAPAELGSEKASNYRRWWNNAWQVVEPAGQQNAGIWTREKELRLRALAEQAHANGLWIRFYTLDGATEKELSCNGWFRTYNFGTLDAARTRWRAAIAAGVDYIASDQYEALASEIHSTKADRLPALLRKDPYSDRNKIDRTAGLQGVNRRENWGRPSRAMR